MRIDSLPLLAGDSAQGYRLVNSKFPPIALFEDVANAEDFEVLYQVQAITNPRILNELGRLELIPRAEIPFGITGCSYATAPFTHVNPEGSRFSDGRFGVLYVADDIDTAVAEVSHHQTRYWSKVPGLRFERFVFRGLSCKFTEAGMRDACGVAMNDPIYSSDDYSAAHSLGLEAKRAGCTGLRYNSVRAQGQTCWALLTPKSVTSIIQAAHYEMVWNGAITSINKLQMISS
ncbi:RES family NAD+ phosphorylase [Devosia sp.]|uniref:RES family NAD+ phosphorylase n=1 Tax=Devosia sp. TaxID=1871048 RepID=UPI002735F415|nr:RES family NAD+ phosphorylase [Devosia sp.]MDP2780473.1 RES family NAD+ phosphorylase [Devosia sp.]